MVVVVMATIQCFAQNKNTAKSRFWHAFNARYNTYYNGHLAFIDGNLEKEKGNKDIYTELIPLYTVGNKVSRELGKSHFERTVEKMEKAIQRHSIKFKGREQNPFLWKAWLMMGKAQFQMGQFEEAAATFSYMLRLYQGDPMRSGLARAWLAKSYTMLGWRYDAEDVIRSMSRDSMDFRAVKDWDYTYANYYVNIGDYVSAIPYLYKVVKHERRRVQRAREWFLIGQLQNKLGRQKEAFMAFRRVVRCSPPYELEFNARIAQTEVLAKNNGKKMIGRLKRMAANDNNADYQDQIYYAIGNIYLAQNDTLQAISAYEKGCIKSLRNGIEKGVLLHTLGNLYWKCDRFADAKRCYGEAIGLLDKDFKGYDDLDYRSKVLDELVPYTESIHLQDSLLQLARMSETERNIAIDRVIESLKNHEQQTAPLLPDISAPSPVVSQSIKGGWYFYNAMAVAQGKTTFLREWGKRENIDNWRRSNQTVVRMTLETDDADSQILHQQSDSIANDSVVKIAGELAQLDTYTREYYLAQIPFTQEQQAACHEIIKEGLLYAGIILKDKLDKFSASERYLHRLVTDYPHANHNDEAFYHLWLLYLRQGRYDEATKCLNYMKQQYAASEWTQLVSDPYYAENARFGEHLEDSLYAATYQAFKQGKNDVVENNYAISNARFIRGAHRDKFLFVSALSSLNKGEGDSCMAQLQQVITQFPHSEVSPLAGMIIKGVQAGRKLHGGKFDIGDVWAQRNIELSVDSTINDTLSSDRNDHYLFMLVYHPDSVNQNQLLYELARYNFTNFLVRNFEIQVSRGENVNRMMVSGFQNFDEALQYARMLYQNKTMSSRFVPAMRFIVSEKNLPLLGTRFSYDEYQQFYEREMAPLPVSKDDLLMNPDSLDAPDIEDEELVKPAKNEEPVTHKNKLQLDFDDDFW